MHPIRATLILAAVLGSGCGNSLKMSASSDARATDASVKSDGGATDASVKIDSGLRLFPEAHVDSFPLDVMTTNETIVASLSAGLTITLDRGASGSPNPILV